MNFEPLESRLFLSADPGGSLAKAAPLGQIVNTRVVAGSLSSADIDDFFKISLKSRGNLSISLAGLAANANLQLLSASGHAIATSSSPGSADESIVRSVAAGSYYLRVFAAAGPVDTEYSLQIQADLNWSTIAQSGKKRKVGLVFADGDAHPVRTDLQTWIIVHGWNSDPDSLSSISDAVAELEPASQVLVVDWSDAADRSLDLALSAVPAVAKAITATLKRWGLPGSRINLIGHSFGGFLIDRIAAGITKGVNRMVAIDPADDIVTSVNYAAHSRYSQAFVASQFSTPAHALTADETFKMNVGPFDSILSHVFATDLYASMLHAAAGDDPDAISQLFSLDRLSKSVKHPWKLTKAYEGTLVGSATFFTDWNPVSLTFKNPAGKTVKVRA